MKWETEIIEISNNVYRLIMINEYGSKIEKTGTDIELMIEEAKKDTMYSERQIRSKI